MLWSMPPVTATSNRWSTRPSTAALSAASPDAHAASVVKFGPRKLNRFATRPAITLASSPGIVSSLISPQWAWNAARVSSRMCSRWLAGSEENDGVAARSLSTSGSSMRMFVL
jgi:hypothetical protein